MNFGFFSFLKPKSLVSFVIYISPHTSLDFKNKNENENGPEKIHSSAKSILVPNICISISINITSKIFLIIQETENHYNTNRLS